MDIQVQEPMTTQELVEKNRAEKRVERETTDDARTVALFDSNEAQNFRSRWEKIQIGFVDEPRTAVQQADELVASVIQRLAQVFADERNRLESDWGKGDDVSTEDLRMSLRRYRSLFDRLLSV